MLFQIGVYIKSNRHGDVPKLAVMTGKFYVVRMCTNENFAQKLVTELYTGNY